MFFYFKINHVLFSYFQVIDNISGQLDFGGYWLFNSFGKHVNNYQFMAILTEVARDPSSPRSSGAGRQIWRSTNFVMDLPPPLFATLPTGSQSVPANLGTTVSIEIHE